MFSLSLAAGMGYTKSSSNAISVSVFQYLCTDNRLSDGLAGQSYEACEGGLKEKAENLFTH